MIVKNHEIVNLLRVPHVNIVEFLSLCLVDN